MKEERRRMSRAGTSTDAKTAKPTKPDDHCETKDQQQYLSKQLTERSVQYQQSAQQFLPLVPKVGEVVTRGRRVQDKKHIAAKMESEKAKRANMTRAMISIEDVKEKAKGTVLVNDKLMLQGADEVTLRKRVKELTVQSFWSNMKEPSEYRTLFAIAIDSFPFLFRGAVVKPKKVLTSRTAVMVNVIKPYLEISTKVSTCIHEMLYGEKGDKRQVPKRERDSDIMDMFNLFVKPVPSAWDEETIQPATLALVASFKVTDPHYKDTSTENNTVNADACFQDDEDATDATDDVATEDYGQILEEEAGEGDNIQADSVV
jgi:hypothetical protein